MEEWTNYATYYPSISHPLKKERDSLKSNYVTMLTNYANKFGGTICTALQISIICKALSYGMEQSNRHGIDSQNSEKVIFRTYFSPFRFFSYRYLFLFDCLLMLAVDNKKKGISISNEIKKCVRAKYHNKIDDIVLQMYEGNTRFIDNTLITEEMANAWNKARQYATSTEKSVIFTATMSAGKSTLINAIVGKNLLGIKKAACTSQVTSVHSIPSPNGLYMVSYKDTWEQLSNPKDVQKYIAECDGNTEIITNFYSQLSLSRYTLIDTPGVDSSLNPDHKKTTRRILKDRLETIVYVIPVDTYGSEDDYNHLMYIHKNVSFERIIFIVNMIDTIDPEDDSVDVILSDIENHLRQIGFNEPTVFPISAKAGLLLKQKLSGSDMSENEIENCRHYSALFSKTEYALDKYYPIINESDKKTYNWICQGYDEEMWSAYINTGLPGLEKILINS